MIQFDLTDLPPNIRKQAEEKLEQKKSKFSSVKTIIDGHAEDTRKSRRNKRAETSAEIFTSKRIFL